jgi:DnaJ-class molecular chaperone
VVLQVLSDPKKREVYDAYGEEALKSGMPPGGPGGGGMGGMPGGGFGGFSTRYALAMTPLPVTTGFGSDCRGASG